MKVVVPFLLLISSAACAGLDVRTFGAVGDGVADDTSAFQRAADAATVSAGDAGERRWMVTRYGARAMSDAFTREIVVPPGRYRLSGPVVFDFNVTVRGTDATIIVPEGGTGFFLQQALRVELDGLTFEGGAVHVRHWSANRDTATCLVRRCRFVRASDVAFTADAFRAVTHRKYATRAEEMQAGVLRHTCPSVVAAQQDGRWKLTPREPGTYEAMENSTNFIFDDCRFEENSLALDVRSDGCVIRNSAFIALDGARHSQLELGVRSHVTDCRFVFSSHHAAAAAVCHSGNHTFDGCEFHSSDPLPVVRYMDPPSPGYVASSLAIRYCTVQNGEVEVVRFADGAIPNSISITGLQGKGRLFGFDRVPSVADLAEMLKGRRHPDLGPALSYGVSVSQTDGFDDDLPSVLEPFRHTVPDAMRRRCPTWVVTGEDCVVRTLPDGYLTVTNTILCRDGEVVRAGGRCVLLVSDDRLPAFRVPAGARVRFENLTVHRGMNAIRVDGNGLADVRNCAFYEQAGETFQVPTGSLVVFGGMAYTPFLYRGGGNACFDAFWYSALPDHGDVEYRNRSYAAISVDVGGKLILRDLLGVPCYFRHVLPMHKIWRVRPSEDQAGDFRWIDSFGAVELYDCRLGGEWGGLTPVYQHGPARTYLEGPYFATDCPRLRSTEAVRCIDSAQEPLIVDSVTTQYVHPYAERAYNTFPHRHEPESAGGETFGSSPLGVTVETETGTNRLVVFRWPRRL